MSQFSLNTIKFEDVRQEIINFLKDKSEYSSTFDFEGSNMSMVIDSMAYVSMLMSYQLANISNNLFLDTTESRKNAVSIAKTMGYRPRRVTSAKITGTIYYEDLTKTFTSADSITIPTNTKFFAAEGYVFLNLSPITLTLSSNSDNILLAEFSIFEGSIKQYNYLGNGLPFQSLTIPSKKVEENNLTVYVKNNTDNNIVRWEEVKQSFNLIQTESYFVEEDIQNEGYVKIIFGDGSISSYPTTDQVVIAEYIESVGNEANGIKLTSWDVSGAFASFPEFNTDNFRSIINSTTKSFGGSPTETLEDIKQSAPKSFAMAGRAVTKNDYNTLLTSNSYVYKSNVIGGDQLFKGDSTKLGNIYLTALPLYIDISDILASVDIYLSPIQESELLVLLNKYRIISTNIEFIKPTYIHIVASPEVEISQELNTFEENRIISETTNALKNYVAVNFNKFNPILRSTRLNSVISSSNNVLSSNINYEYNFIISKNSFYESGSDDVNIMYMPIKIEAKDSVGVVTDLSNFIKTNLEQRELLGLEDDEFLEYEDRTIYGRVIHPNADRYIYNEDNAVSGVAETCNLYIKGDTKMFDLYRFETNYQGNAITNPKTFTVNYEEVDMAVDPIYTGLPGSQYDDYTLTIGTSEIGTVKRTNNKDYGFVGFVRSEADIISTTNGDFYEALLSFEVTGTADKDFTSITAGDFIIYNADLSGGTWIKTTDKGTISAADDTNLFKATQDNAIYEIDTAGDFSGWLTESVTAGEYIILNPESVVNPTYKWEKLHNHLFNVQRDGLWGLSASAIDYPIEATDYEIKNVTNTIAATNFGGRTDAMFNLDDIIFFNPAGSADEFKWQLLVNSASADSLSPIDSSPITAGSLEVFDYDPVSGDFPVSGFPYAYRVVNNGNFGTSYVRVNWNGAQTAYEDDILLYVGDGKWNIYQPAYPSLFNIDAANPNTLPVQITYGDYFSIEVSGDFNGNSSIIYEVGDNIVYVGNANWIPLTSESTTLDATSSDNLPPEAEIGDMLYVTEDGNFDASYIIAPASADFIQGDYMIFNGSNWIKMREYSFEYNQISTEVNGRDFLNEIGLNSVFYYKYNVNTNLYEFYFDDIFKDALLGVFKYNSVSGGLDEYYDTGKIVYNLKVNGKYNLNDTLTDVNIRELFTDDLSLIRILPKNKIDSKGLLLNDTTTDFDSYFNNFVTFDINDTETVRY